MDNVEQVLAVGGSVVIWVVTTAVSRVRRRVDPASRAVTGPALATLWAALVGSRYGVLAAVDHSAAFRAHFGDAAATYSDVQNAITPWLVVGAVLTLVSQARALARAVAVRSGVRAAAAPAGQVPVVDLSAGR